MVCGAACLGAVFCPTPQRLRCLNGPIVGDVSTICIRCTVSGGYAAFALRFVCATVAWRGVDGAFTSRCACHWGGLRACLSPALCMRSPISACSKYAAKRLPEMHIFEPVASFGECNGWAGFNPKEYFSWCRPVEHYPRRIVD